jgi:ribosomal protein L7/L12
MHPVSASGPSPARRLPANVLDALARGRAIEAIKLLHDSSGISLKDAKAIIDGHLRSQFVAMGPKMSVSTNALPSSVIEALQRGNKIEAIKLLRGHTGLDLKAAKDTVEAIGRGTMVKAGKLSPGEEPRARHVSLWIVAIAVIGTAVYYYFLLRTPN